MGREVVVAVTNGRLDGSTDPYTASLTFVVS